MASPGNWTLLHMRSPLNTSSGTGQYGEITQASNRTLTFSVTDPATLTFDMPGNHPQTQALTPFISDVLVFRDDYAVQRFRVTSQQLAKNEGVLTASFSCVSYKSLLDAWVFHDTGTRSWASATEQSLIAWTIFNEGQTKANGNFGTTRGHIPTTSVTRVLQGSTVNFAPVEYFDAGNKRKDAIDQIAEMTSSSGGFDWDIVPDPAAQYTALKFHVWAIADGGRNQFTPGRATMVLDDGGTIAEWTHTTAPDTYGNVVRVNGDEGTSDNQFSATSLAVWVPSTQNPAGTPAEGRWERSVSNNDWTTTAAAQAGAQAEFDKANLFTPEITASLRRGIWDGPTELWLGDKIRMIITEPTLGSTLNPANVEDWILYIDEDVRVVEIDVRVDEEGAEDVSLSINRQAFSARRDAKTIKQRLGRLERRR